MREERIVSVGVPLLVLVCGRARLSWAQGDKEENTGARCEACPVSVI